AVGRGPVLRLASVLGRLRRATTMETGLFEIQAQYYRQNCQLLPNSCEVIHTTFRRAESASGDAASSLAVSNIETRSSGDSTAVEFARCFLRVANLPNFALDRLSRYESTLRARPVGSFTRSRPLIDANRRSGAVVLRSSREWSLLIRSRRLQYHKRTFR